MGYELHITRAADWVDSEGQPIGRAEWAAYADRHPELVANGWVEWADIGREITYDCTDKYGQVARLSWRHGHVVVTCGEDYSKLLAIATDLGARLVGDEDEVYTLWGSVRPE